jgi:hypothetical protein
MSFFVRRVTPTKWHPRSALTATEELDVTGNFKRQTHGLSVWKVTTSHERELVLAALMADRAKVANFVQPRVDSLNVLEIDEGDVLQLARGPILPTPQRTSTPILPARPLHHDLDWVQSDLDALALWLACHRQLGVTRCPRTTVLQALRSLQPSDLDVSARPWWGGVR